MAPITTASVVVAVWSDIPEKDGIDISDEMLTILCEMIEELQNEDD